MSDQAISCPQCGTQIPLTEALSHQIKERLKNEFEKEQQKKEQELSERQARLEEERKRLSEEKLSMEKIVEERLKEAGAKQEQELSRQKEAFELEKKRLEQEKIALAEEAEKKLAAEREEMQRRAEAKAQEKLSTELADLKMQNEERARELEEVRKNELELRKKAREIEEREKKLELEMQRKMDEEKEKIADLVRRSTEDEFRMKMLEKEKQLEQAQRQADDLRRKLEQGSMQIQGDVQENDLRDMLRTTFFSDLIEDVPTGIRGADLVQTVHNQFGQKCGVILWESKNTKAWNNDWVKKLRGDQGLANADICVLVTKVLPEGIQYFGLMDGVWVCEYGYALPLVQTLRLSLLELHKVKQASVGKGEKMEALYEYLSGSQFKNRIENIVMAFTGMKEDLESEKRAFQRIWSKREKEIERVTLNTVGMYGDFQGIIGAAALPQVEKLELPLGEQGLF
jgi:hypothetical protein